MATAGETLKQQKAPPAEPGRLNWGNYMSDKTFPPSDRAPRILATVALVVAFASVVLVFGLWLS